MEVTETAADAGGGEAAGRAGPLPGQPDVGGEVVGEVQLGVAGDDQPGPPVGGGRVAQLGPGPAEHLFQEPERMFDIEAAQERLPGAVHLAGAPKPGKPGPGRPPGSKNRRPATRHDVGKTVKRDEPKKKSPRQQG